MKLILRLLTVCSLITGGIVLTRLSIANNELEEQIAQLEAELGRMTIDDPDRVHLVEIKAPVVPPEVASRIERVWQFRCYLPRGYNVVQFSGAGRVTKEGVYLDGGSNSSWGSPLPEAVHHLVTMSLQKKGGRLEQFYRFGGSSGTTTWDLDQSSNPLAVRKLVSSQQGARSFDRNTILPLLKIYVSGSGKDEKVAGHETTTYSGGMFALCPRSRETAFEQLKRGEVPSNFDPSWIAGEAADE